MIRVSHEVDFTNNNAVSTCNCGITFTNPFIRLQLDTAPLKPANNYFGWLWGEDWGKDEDYFEIDGVE